MKYILATFLLCPLLSLAQNNTIRAEGISNIDVWKPYLFESTTAQESTDAIKSSTFRLGLSTEFRLNEKWWFALGLSYKRIDYRVIDRLQTWTYTKYYTEQGMSYSEKYKVVYVDPADLVAKSNDFGIHLESNYELAQRNNWRTSIGLTSEFYLAELYRSYYASDDFDLTGFESGHPETTLGDFNQFRFSGVNLDIHYRVRWQFASQFNAGLKLSVGTNLYSNWSHFSRNAWIGCGLEIGFRRKPKVE